MFHSSSYISPCPWCEASKARRLDEESITTRNPRSSVDQRPKTPLDAVLVAPSRRQDIEELLKALTPGAPTT